MQKAFKLNITDLGDTKPKLQISYTTDVENLNLKINWNVTMPPGNKFRPERLILLYNENNNKAYKFISTLDKTSFILQIPRNNNPNAKPVTHFLTQNAALQFFHHTKWF